MCFGATAPFFKNEKLLKYQLLALNYSIAVITVLIN
jgi:hypothetical protein